MRTTFDHLERARQNHVRADGYAPALARIDISADAFGRSRAVNRVPVRFGVRETERTKIKSEMPWLENPERNAHALFISLT